VVLRYISVCKGEFYQNLWKMLMSTFLLRFWASYFEKMHGFPKVSSVALSKIYFFHIVLIWWPLYLVGIHPSKHLRRSLLLKLRLLKIVQQCCLKLISTIFWTNALTDWMLCYKQPLVLHCVLLIVQVLWIAVHHIFTDLLQLENTDWIFLLSISCDQALLFSLVLTCF